MLILAPVRAAMSLAISLLKPLIHGWYNLGISSRSKPDLDCSSQMSWISWMACSMPSFGPVIVIISELDSDLGTWIDVHVFSCSSFSTVPALPIRNLCCSFGTRTCCSAAFTSSSIILRLASRTFIYKGSN